MRSLETVTILFTDLVGSTGLETRIGPGAADELRVEHFELIRSALAEAGGREVKNTGDGVMAAFDSASAASACAVLMQQRFEQRNREQEIQLLIRVGISLGDATAEEGDYFGLPVIEAARLCDRAEAGEILAREAIAHLTGGRGEHRFRSVGELELKGIPDAVGVVEVIWEPIAAAAAPLSLPSRLQELPPGSFVGRAADRARLAELAAEARAGRTRLALLAGEPGIGKTRLATHTAMEARAEGATVLYGRADEELALPYGPWIEALRHYVLHAPEPTLREYVASSGGELARLLPELAQRLADAPAPRETDPDTERYLLWGAVVGLLARAGQDAPLVVILDDLHWADKPTLQLLKHVTAHGSALPLLLLGTYRDSDVAQGDPLSQLLADLRREQGVERLALTGLDAFEITELLQNAAGHELDDAGRDLALQLHRETDGNAFYTGELLRHLLESSALIQDDHGRWTVRDDADGLGLPESVREVIGQRIHRLGDDVHQALCVAAVIGRDFDVDLLCRISDRTEDDLLELLDHAVRASVLTESTSAVGRFSFAHALVNHTLYEELGARRRARLHRQVAEALEDLLDDDPGERVGELALHWARATTPADVPRAIEYARRAGERAREDLAPDEAIRWFSQALELTGPDPDRDGGERCDLLISLGEAQRDAGEPPYRDTLLEATRIAEGLGDPDRAARAALANNRGQMSRFGEVDDERIAALDRAIELGGRGDAARRSRLLALKAIELQLGPRVAEAPALAQEAIELARASRDLRALGEALRAATLAHFGPDTSLSLRQSFAEELLELNETLGDPSLEFWATHSIEDVHMERAERALAAAAAERGRAIAEELGSPSHTWFRRYFDAALALSAGDFDLAERLVREALEIGTSAGQPDALMIFGAQFSQLRHMQGRAEEMVELVEQAAQLNPGIPSFAAGLAVLLATTGRHEQAATLLDRALAGEFTDIPRDQPYLTCLSLYSETAALVEAPAAAAKLYDLLLPFRHRASWTGANSYGSIELYLGRLADTTHRDRLADEHFIRACDIHELNGIRYWAAYGRVSWAESLARRGDIARARVEAERALALSSGRGYGEVDRRAHAVISDAGTVPA